MLDEADESIPYVYSITSYGADYPVDSLVKRIQKEDIVVPTFRWNSEEETTVVGFQREYVWNQAKADKFIESLLLGLPVPGIFLVKEPSGRLLVLDGHQRLHTLASFYRGILEGKEYSLRNVQEQFKGKTYDNLDIEDRRRLDDSIMHATIIRQDEPTEDQSSIYVIFERLNTGGVNLQPQEIRVALYHGEFVRVLNELNNNTNWRLLVGKPSRRLKDMELILRFLAFLFYSDQYKRPMKDFLNKYMATNRYLKRQSEHQLKDIFDRTVQAIIDSAGTKAFRPRRSVNAATVDSMMTGIAKRIIDKGVIKNTGVLTERIERLLQNQAYLVAIETGTSEEGKVKDRMEAATLAFADIT
ncbi:DUF262 domain-containing protein [Patescibacteria group bacterium]|nr:DUF262 domain-containing protein [Patescibacteria group bacterium]